VGRRESIPEGAHWEYWRVAGIGRREGIPEGAQWEYRRVARGWAGEKAYRRGPLGIPEGGVDHLGRRYRAGRARGR